MKKDAFKLTPLLFEDIQRIEKINPETWHDTISMYSGFFDYEGFFALKIEFDNELIAVGEVILHEASGWLGKIVVDERFRGKGLGRELTQELSNYISSKGRKTQLLLATPEGRPMYKKMGFELESEYIFLKRKENVANVEYSPDQNLKKYAPQYFNSLCVLDKEAYGENRAELMSRNVEHSTIYISPDSTKVQGYCMPQLGNGLVVAKTPNAGIALLKYKLSTYPNWIICPQENKISIDFGLNNGYEFYRKAYRMIKGDQIKWQPKNIFCRIGGYLG